MTKSATREAADKVTFTQTEVTSAVALKAPIASPSFTGNVGVGVTPESSYPDRPVVRVGSGLGLQCRATGNPSHTWINSNSYQDASTAADKYIGTDQASQIKQTNGAFTFNVAPSGTADAAISWNTAMTIDNAGIVTKPLQPAFLAQGANGQNNIAVGSASIILLPTERFDNNNDFSSNTFTAPVTGKYQLNSHVYLLQMPTNSSYFETYLVTSNKTYAGAITPSSYGGGGISYVSIEIAVLADMDAGDTAFLRISQGSGTQSTDVHQNTAFSGYLVC